MFGPKNSKKKRQNEARKPGINPANPFPKERPVKPRHIPGENDRSLGTKRPFRRLPEANGVAERNFQLWAPRFLEVLAETGSVSSACASIPISMRTFYRYKKLSPDFEEACAVAMMAANADLEESALQRAIFGTEKPVYYKGEVVGAITEYDNNLTKWMLERRMPETYGPPEQSREDEANELATLIIKALGGMDESVPAMIEADQTPKRAALPERSATDPTPNRE